MTADSVQDQFVSIPVDAGACTAPGQRKKKQNNKPTIKKRENDL